MSRRPNIAIDGPAGSGKSTVARLVARRLGYLYVDTGAMYRAITYLALKAAIDLEDHQALGALAAAVKFSAVHYSGSGEIKLWCNGEDISPYLRNWDVTREVARLAAVAEVRHRLVRSQRMFARSGGVVMEGRDIGTVVLPDAELKFFLTADLDARVERRALELSGDGQAVDPGELRRQFIYRDEMDLKRSVGPLKKAPDAVVIDGTALTVEDIVSKIASVCQGGGLIIYWICRAIVRFLIFFLWRWDVEGLENFPCGGAGYRGLQSHQLLGSCSDRLCPAQTGIFYGQERDFCYSGIGLFAEELWASFRWTVAARTAALSNGL